MTNKLGLGQQTEDGIYAGLTLNGKQQIFVYPEDIISSQFNDAAKAVEKLNTDKALNHDDWQIGSRDVMYVVQKNRHEGKLEGSFLEKKGDPSVHGSNDWSASYWTSDVSSLPSDGSTAAMVTITSGMGNSLWNSLMTLRQPMGSSNVR